MTIDQLEAARREALAKADDMVSRKGRDYGHWSEYPEVVLASLTFVKAKRMLELAIRAKVGDGKEANEPMEDSALDLINYASFMYGKVRDRKEAQK